MLLCFLVFAWYPILNINIKRWTEQRAVPPLQQDQHASEDDLLTPSAACFSIYCIPLLMTRDCLCFVYLNFELFVLLT
jgi:hypothetical protein